MLEVVVWRDAHFYEDEPEVYPEDFLVTTVGWTEDDGGKFLKVTAEKTPFGPRAITRIPWGMIESRKVVDIGS